MKIPNLLQVHLKGTTKMKIQYLEFAYKLIDKWNEVI